jgi:hypothetical protein
MVAPKKAVSEDMKKNSRFEKKAWQQPELIVLVRSNPEETVLMTCKSNQIAGSAGSRCKRGPVRCSLINKS